MRFKTYPPGLLSYHVTLAMQVPGSLTMTAMAMVRLEL
jgi:hypothetical protein